MVLLTETTPLNVWVPSPIGTKGDLADKLWGHNYKLWFPVTIGPPRLKNYALFINS